MNRLTWKGNETTCKRFYIVVRPGYVSLYDTRNRLAGGTTCDTVAEAKELAQSIAEHQTHE